MKTASGAPAVYSSRPGSRNIEHIGSARDQAELEVLKAAAPPAPGRQRALYEIS